MVKSFKTFLIEKSDSMKNTHLLHIEDLPLDYGSEGLNKVLNIFKHIKSQLLGKDTGPSVKITTKVDGSPALIWGRNPENKKFFVGTKSVFAKTPKINYTDQDIDNNHPEPGLNIKLKYALRNLVKLKPKSIFQGDMMFTKDDLEKKNIHGVDYVIFRPNTITYAVPIDSDMAKEILLAQMGIVLHTEYLGKSMDDLHTNTIINTKHLTKNKDVWLREADFSEADKKVDMTKTDIKDFDIKLKVIEQFGNKIKSFLDELQNQKGLIENIERFNNSLIKLGDTKLMPGEKYTRLLDYLDNKMSQDIDLLKTDSGKQKAIERKNLLLDFIKINKDKIISLYELQRKIVVLKLTIIRKLEQLQQFSTFVNDGKGGYDFTKPEGFVVTTGEGITKLIDRDEFSRLNFQLAKNWTKV